MKHIKKRIISTVLIVIFLTGCVSTQEETAKASKQSQQKDWNYEFRYGNGGAYWSCYDLSGSFIPTQKDYEELVAAYIPQIENLLGLEDWYTQYDTDTDTIMVYLEILDVPNSYSYPPTRYMNNVVKFDIVLALDQVQMPTDCGLAHALTHSLLGADSFNRSLEVGICDYANARIGANFYSFFEEYNIDILDFYTYDVSLTLESLYDASKRDEILDSIGHGEEYPYAIGTLDGQIWYECSRIFAEYLVKNYGMEKTLRLLREGKNERDYQTYLGVDYNTLKEEWTAFVKNYEPMHTMEEYQQLLKAFYFVNGTV